MHRHIMIALTVLAALASSANADTFFSSTLDSAQEVAPGGVTNSTATGTASLVLNDAQTALTYEIRIMGIDFTDLANGVAIGDITGDNSATRLHIHDGDIGFNGPVVFGQFNPGHDPDDLNIAFDNNTSEWVITGIWEESDNNGNALLSTQLPDLLNDGLYFNLHTVGDTGGAIRGQIVLVPEPTTLALGGIGALGILYFVRRHRRVAG